MAYHCDIEASTTYVNVLFTQMKLTTKKSSRRRFENENAVHHTRTYYEFPF